MPRKVKEPFPKLSIINPHILNYRGLSVGDKVIATQWNKNRGNLENKVGIVIGFSRNRYGQQYAHCYFKNSKFSGSEGTDIFTLHVTDIKTCLIKLTIDK